MNGTNAARSRSGLALALAAALTVAAVPAAALAQQSHTETLLAGDLSPTERNALRAEAEERAYEAAEQLRQARLAEEAEDWRKAARLYERLAALLPEGERKAIEAYRRAGRAYYFSDDPARASRVMEKAADRALMHGDVYRAADSYLMAGLAAHERGHETRAVELGWKAYHLSRSEVLTEDQREELQARIRVRPS